MHKSVAVALALLAVAACGSLPGGSNSSSGESTATPLGPVAGVPLPNGYELDQGRSLVLGEGDRWTGRFSYTLNSPAASMVDYYRRQMPTMGWQEISVVRAETSVLVYVSPGTQRAATVHIQPRTLIGSRVDVVVSPATQGTAPSAAGPIALPPASGGVVDRPISLPPPR